MNETKTPPPPPAAVQLEEVDVLRLVALTERKGRIVAETARWQAELAAASAQEVGLVGDMQTKYGIDLREYSIDADKRVALRR